MPSLYEEIKKAGIPIGNHCSDLYFKRTPESLEILTKHDLQKKNATYFTNQINGEIWVDVPFAYDPYWENKKTTIMWSRGE